MDSSISSSTSPSPTCTWATTSSIRILRDKRVRQAITYGIDKQEIVDGILLGQGVTAEGPYKPDMWAFNPKIKKYPFDPGEGPYCFWKKRDS